MRNETFDTNKLLRTLKKGQSFFGKYTVPLFGDNRRGQPEVYGTALVVALEERIFLVSAAHVFDHLKFGVQLYVYSDTNTKRYLSGTLALTSVAGGGARDNDSLDVGVLELKGGRLPPYPKVNCEPLSFGALLPNSLPREGKYYLTMGYPATRTRINSQRMDVTSGAYANFGPAISSKHYDQLKLNRQAHIAVAFHKNNVVGESGRTQSFPDPHGMSGSPCWLLYDENIKANVFGGFKVAGVLTRYCASDKILLATDIAVAIDLMIEANKGQAAKG